MLNTMQEVKLHEKKAIPNIAYNRAKGNLGLSEYSKLKMIMQTMKLCLLCIIIKRLEKRFLLKARGNDEKNSARVFGNVNAKTVHACSST